MATTKVTVDVTTISFFDYRRQAQATCKVLDKLTVIKSKKHVRALHNDNVFLSKVNSRESFEVDTQALYDLKGN